MIKLTLYCNWQFFFWISGIDVPVEVTLGKFFNYKQ